MRNTLGLSETTLRESGLQLSLKKGAVCDSAQLQVAREIASLLVKLDEGTTSIIDVPPLPGEIKHVWKAQNSHDREPNELRDAAGHPSHRNPKAGRTRFRKQI